MTTLAPKKIPKVTRIAALLLASSAIVLLALAPAPSERWAMTCRRPLRARMEHAGRCDRGTVVRTSSVASDLQSHALFLIDGRIGPLIEKWMNQLRDTRPWIELSWEQPLLVQRVVIHHAGVQEAAALNTADFDLAVRAPGGTTFEVVARIRDNRSSKTRIELAARAVEALRIEILRANYADNRARIYEVEVLGERRQ